MPILKNSLLTKLFFCLQYKVLSTIILGFPGGSDSKKSACNAGDLGSTPELGRSPGGGHGNPLQYSCLENPQAQRSLAGYSPRGRKESYRTEQLGTAQHFYTTKRLLQSRTKEVFQFIVSGISLKIQGFIQSLNSISPFHNFYQLLFLLLFVLCYRMMMTGTNLRSSSPLLTHTGLYQPPINWLSWLSFTASIEQTRNCFSI